MRNVALEGTSLNPGENYSGLLLASFDPDFANGRGAATWTATREEALAFDSVKDGYQLWTTQSVLMPVRGDGRPNRPLTAYSVEFVTDEQLDADPPTEAP